MLQKLLALTILAALLMGLTGCVDMAGLVGGGATEEASEPEATPMPPLTEPKYESKSQLYTYYDAIDFTDTLDSLTAKYGEPAVEKLEGGSAYTWEVEPQLGFAAAFFSSGRLRGKVLFYRDIRQLYDLAPGKNLDMVTSLQSETTYDVVASMFGGGGLEISAIAEDESVKPGIQHVYMWVDGEGNVVQALFDAENKLVQASQGSAK